MQQLEKFYQSKLPNLPPMQGGWLGWFAYELGGCFESVPTAKHNDFALPLAMLGLYDVVLSWDHSTGDGYIISRAGLTPNPMPDKIMLIGV